MGKLLAILLGLAAMAGGVYLVIDVWWVQFITVVKGFIPPILFFGGLIAFIAGISSLKDSSKVSDVEDKPGEEKSE